jgi:hypothetical protein
LKEIHPPLKTTPPPTPLVGEFLLAAAGYTGVSPTRPNPLLEPPFCSRFVPTRKSTTFTGAANYREAV